MTNTLPRMRNPLLTWKYLGLLRAGAPLPERIQPAALGLASKDQNLDRTLLAAAGDWVVNGCPSFALTHSCVAALSLTDPAIPFHLPYPTVMIELPDPLFVQGYDGSKVQKFLAATCENIVDPFTGATNPGAVFCTDQADCIAGEWHYFAENSPDLVDLAFKSALFRLAGNLSEYLRSETGRADYKPKPRLPVHSLDAPVKRWLVGRPIVVSPEVREAARTFLQGDAPRWKLMSRHLVRGHWRNQSCGTGHADHKRIWIEPFWKGPRDLTEAALRTYVVK